MSGWHRVVGWDIEGTGSTDFFPGIVRIVAGEKEIKLPQNHQSRFCIIF